MANKDEKLTDRKQCNVRISFGDSSDIKATHGGIRKVTWSAKKTDTGVLLNNALFSKELAMDLLSVPAFARIGVCSLLLPDCVLLLDIDKSFKLLGRTDVHSDGLYYIGGIQEQDSHLQKNEQSALRAVVKAIGAFDDISESQNLKIHLGAENTLKLQKRMMVT